MAAHVNDHDGVALLLRSCMSGASGDDRLRCAGIENGSLGGG
jgi:hypothetical protein